MRKGAVLLGAVLLLGATILFVVQSRADDVIYRTQSEFNTIIVSEDSQGIRTLRFEEYGARQSVVKPGDPDYIALPYAKAVHVGLAISDDPRRVLVVGLGGGTIPQFLHHHFPQWIIDVAEIDPAVVRVARSYFGFRPDDKLRAFVTDGRAFIEQSQPVYDVIYLDAYSADSVPYSLTTLEFLQATKRALAPGGVVVGNVWSSQSNKLYHSMVRTYQEVFPHVAINDVRGVGNRIVIATGGGDLPTQKRVAELAARLSVRGKFRYDLRQIVEDGYTLLDEPDSKGEILKDRY